MVEISTKTWVPFDKQILATRLKSRDVTAIDLLNHPAVSFSSSQLAYYKLKGFIPKEYSDQIEKALDDASFKKRKHHSGIKYNGEFVDFGVSVHSDLLKRCKDIGSSLVNVLSIEHISGQTIYNYRKERHIPSDLLEKINRRIDIMEKESKTKSVVHVSEEPKVEQIPISELKIENKLLEPVTVNKLGYVIQDLKKVVRCNGEASLCIDNISQRYNCDIATFVNAVFSLVSCENYVIYTTYNNGKPIFTLGEPM